MCTQAPHSSSAKTHACASGHVCTVCVNVEIYTSTLKVTQLCTNIGAERKEKKGQTHRHHQLKGLLVHPHGRLVLLHHCEGSGFTSNLHKNKHTHVSTRTSMKIGRCASCSVLHRDCLLSSYRRRTGTIVQGTEGGRVLSLHSTFHISEQLCRAHRGRTHAGGRSDCSRQPDG